MAMARSRSSTEAGPSDGPDMNGRPGREVALSFDGGSDDDFAPFCAVCRLPCYDPQNRVFRQGVYMHRRRCASGTKWFDGLISSHPRKAHIQQFRCENPKQYEYMKLDMLHTVDQNRQEGRQNRGKEDRNIAFSFIDKLCSFSRLTEQKPILLLCLEAFIAWHVREMMMTEARIRPGPFLFFY